MMTATPHNGKEEDFQLFMALLDGDRFDDLEDDLPADEFEALQDQVLDQATAARTMAELRIEIQLLRKLESLAYQVRQSGTDRKWEELRRLLLDEQAMYDADGRRRKLVIFTEHRDTLLYLADQIQMLLGKAEAVVTIHGGKLREELKRAPRALPPLMTNRCA